MSRYKLSRNGNPRSGIHIVGKMDAKKTKGLCGWTVGQCDFVLEGNVPPNNIEAYCAACFGHFINDNNT